MECAIAIQVLPTDASTAALTRAPADDEGEASVACGDAAINNASAADNTAATKGK